MGKEIEGERREVKFWLKVSINKGLREQGLREQGEKERKEVLAKSIKKKKRVNELGGKGVWLKVLKRKKG